MIEFTHGFGVLHSKPFVRSACSPLGCPRSCHGNDDTLAAVTITTSVSNTPGFAASISVSWDHDRNNLANDVGKAIDDIAGQGHSSAPVQIWLEEVRDGDDDLMAGHANPYRDLLQLRRPLPAAASGLETRAFDFERDADEFIEVNNRAFAWHPEQNGMTRDRLRATATEPWFDPEGFRILELEGRIAGYCWTKVHRDHSPPIGEIYVIAIDPDFHGRGLGGPMTLAGLEWLASDGITLGNLYVESDNHRALRTYEKLGFGIHSTNRAYATTPDG